MLLVMMLLMQRIAVNPLLQSKPAPVAEGSQNVLPADCTIKRSLIPNLLTEAQCKGGEYPAACDECKSKNRPCTPRLGPKYDTSPRRVPQKVTVQAGDEKILQAVYQYLAAGDTVEQILTYMRIGRDLVKSDPMKVLQRSGLYGRSQQ